jgi:hypothetical protein
VTINPVQFKAFPDATSGNFASSVTPGNSIILWVCTYNTTGNTISTSSPKYNGASVTGAVKLFELQCPGSFAMYTAIWLLPDVSGSGTSVSYTLTNGNVDSNMGFSIAEVSGLGASPSLDSGASPNPATGSNTAGPNPSSGATGDITAAPEIIVGSYMTDGSPSGPGSPWTTVAPTSFCSTGYQVVTSSGGSYTYSGTSGSVGWAAGVAAIKGGTSHTATASLTVTPSFTAAASKGGAAHTATAALTLTPSFTAQASRGHSRTASLALSPSFATARSQAHVRGAALTLAPAFTARAVGGASPTSSVIPAAVLAGVT